MNDAIPMTETSADVIPQDLAIRAMRDSGYRNTAYAVAELVDNAVEAGAGRVDIVCVERQITVESRATWRITELAVCDDGSGMDAVTLRAALQFGNGTRLTSRSGIGRFGMGLPNSSISQAGRVDVWTWRNGPSNAMRSYLDVEEISRRAQREVPKPTSSEVPKEWRPHMGELGKSGTLVVWSQLDPSRLTSKKASKALENIEREIGRVHRKFIAKGKLEIRLVRVRDGAIAEERLAHVNDPLYLTPAPHLPNPFDKTPMFEKALEDEPIEIVVNGVAHTVWTRYSVARPETNDHVGTAKDRGKTFYGKDAERNAGVSVIRAGRELMLDRSWTNRHDTRERWWGCEVEFPPALDEIFGVTNTKQDATFFRILAEMEWEDLAEDGETLEQTKERLEAEGDPRGVLLHLSTVIKRNLRQLRETIKAQKKDTRGGAGGNRHGKKDPTEEANKKWRQRDEEKPFPGGDDPASDEDAAAIDNDLKEDGRSEAERNEIVARVKAGDLRVIFVDKESGSSANLFTIELRGPITEVVFNRKHPAFYTVFRTVRIDDDLDEMSTDDLQVRLQDASSALHVLFAAWARMEREDAGGAKRFERVREDWGRLARDFLDEDQDTDD